MISAFGKGLAQLGDPRSRAAVWIGVGVATLVFALLWSAVAALLARSATFEWGWLEALVGALGGLAALVLTWLLFPAVAGAVIGLLLEGVARAVERRHYPELPDAKGLPITDTLVATLRLFGVMVAVNLLVLPFLFFPPVFPFVFYGANGYLLGREYFELVALRRLDARAARTMRRAHGGTVFAAGVVTAFLMTVPVVNLFAPVVATAAMVHLFEAWRRRGTRRAAGPVEIQS